MSIESSNGLTLHSAISENFLESDNVILDWREESNTLSLPFVDITTREWCFDGIRIAHSDWNFHQMEKLTYSGTVNNEVVTLFFNLHGIVHTSHQGPSQMEHFELGNFQHNLFYSSSSNGSFESKKKRLSTFMIQFALPTFLRITKNSNEVLDRFAEKIMEGKPIALAKNNLLLTSEMNEAINSILHCHYDKGLKRMYYLSKCVELLVLQADAFDKMARNNNTVIRSSYDTECIYYAKEYLLENMANPPSLIQLAKICGLNEFKLKKGFKEIFGQTVFGFLSDKRLESGRMDLLERTKPVSEIAYELGYSSPQHFSMAFKKKFGVSPNAINKK